MPVAVGNEPMTAVPAAAATAAGVAPKTAPAALPAASQPRIAVVTPCWRIAPGKLVRCIATVRGQTLAATHYLVADGEAVALPEGPDLVHLVLPRNLGNKGAAPRGIGAQLAFNDGFDVVVFLDADNWFDPDHLAQALALLERDRLDVVFAGRRIVFPDGELLAAPDPHDASGAHVDTNC